jgi:hypothetical protein
MKSRIPFRLKASVGVLTALLSVAPLSAQSPAQQPTLKVLYTFRDFGTPNGIVEASPGKFLGMLDTPPGVFSITSGGSYQNVYSFPPNGSGIFAIGLTPALNSQAYGSAENSGPVTAFSELFSIAPDGKLTTHSYNGTTQGTPNIPVQHPDGHLYSIFGIVNGSQTFSRMDYAGNFTPLYTFTGGGYPGFDTMFLGAGGDFYGVWLTTSTMAGIYRITPGGTFSWIVPSFPTGGINNEPVGLLQADDGNLYGTLPQNGPGAGSIYRVTPDGKMNTIYQFKNPELGFPGRMIEGSDGNLYGGAEGQFAIGYHGYSSIFRINPTTAQFETVFALKDARLGGCPCELVQGSDGKIYGAAMNLGTYELGTIFVLDAGLPPPKPQLGLISPSAGAAGQLVLLWGRYLLGTTAVSFNGTPATSFGVPSSQGVWVTVPAGATTGPVTVTTPNGSFTTTSSFTVQ